MSSHRQKLEQQFSQSKLKNFSKLADEQDEEFLNLNSKNDIQYNQLTKRVQKKSIDFDQYNQSKFNVKKVAKKDLFDNKKQLKNQQDSSSEDEQNIKSLIQNFQNGQHEEDSQDEINSDDLSSEEILKNPKIVTKNKKVQKDSLLKKKVKNNQPKQSEDLSLSDDISNENLNQKKSTQQSKQESIKKRKNSQDQNQKLKKKVKKESIDELIKEIEQDNAKNEQNQQKINQDLSKSNSIKNQMRIWRKIIQQQIQLDKPIQLIKQFPQEKNTTSTENTNLQFLILENIQKSIEIQNIILSNLEDQTQHEKMPFMENIKSHEYKINQNYQINPDVIQQQINQNFQNYFPWIEENILNWNQKTQILSQQLKKQGMNYSMNTPLGQAQRAVENPEKILLKSQLKRGNFDIIGELNKGAREFDIEIYDDTDLYQDLIKEYTSENQLQDEDTEQQNNDQRILIQKRLRNFEKKTRNIDRKASKNRKIRYNIHPKLLNFVNPIENNNIFGGRDELVDKIANVQKQIQTINPKDMDIKLF